LLDSTVGVLANQALNYLVSGKVPQRTGNAHPNIVPYQEFPVADGHIMVSGGNDAQYVRLCHLLGAPELAEDPKYKNNAGRLEHRDELIAKLSALTARFKRDDLLGKLDAAGVPAGPINDLAQVFSDPQVIARGMQIERPNAAAKGGKIPGVRTPISFDGWPAAAEHGAPRLGQHTTEILREIGEA
jgi:crotonobetainyl-CoA:carnitine CoA-transferase CaiB-like acyl-CoA transferase